MNDTISIPVGALVDAARELARAARWETATALLDAAGSDAAGPDPRVALAAAEVAVESDWHAGTTAASARIAAVGPAGLSTQDTWDLAFLVLRDTYRERIGRPDEEVRRTAEALAAGAPDEVRRGWARMYQGLIADNLFGDHPDDRAHAPGHYAAALELAGPDDLLRREALRHLGDHAHTRGDHADALDRWRAATTAGARAGNVPGTLSQQMLLAVLARDTGDEAGAAALATEIARWAAAIGAHRLAGQATAFLAEPGPADS